MRTLRIGCPLVPRWVEPLMWLPTLESLRISNASFVHSQLQVDTLLLAAYYTTYNVLLTTDVTVHCSTLTTHHFQRTLNSSVACFSCLLHLECCFRPCCLLMPPIVACYTLLLLTSAFTMAPRSRNTSQQITKRVGGTRILASTRR